MHSVVFTFTCSRTRASEGQTPFPSRTEALTLQFPCCASHLSPDQDPKHRLLPQPLPMAPALVGFPPPCTAERPKVRFFPLLSLGPWLKQETEASSSSPAATRKMENRNKGDWGSCQLRSVPVQRGCSLRAPRCGGAGSAPARPRSAAAVPGALSPSPLEAGAGTTTPVEGSAAWPPVAPGCSPCTAQAQEGSAGVSEVGDAAPAQAWPGAVSWDTSWWWPLATGVQGEDGPQVSKSSRGGQALLSGAGPPFALRIP